MKNFNRAGNRARELLQEVLAELDREAGVLAGRRNHILAALKSFEAEDEKETPLGAPSPASKVDAEAFQSRPPAPAAVGKRGRGEIMTVVRQTLGELPPSFGVEEMSKSLRERAAELGFSPSKTSKYLQRLVDQGILTKSAAGPGHPAVYSRLENS